MPHSVSSDSAKSTTTMSRVAASFTEGGKSAPGSEPASPLHFLSANRAIGWSKPDMDRLIFVPSWTDDGFALHQMTDDKWSDCDQGRDYKPTFAAENDELTRKLTAHCLRSFGDLSLLTSDLAKKRSQDEDRVDVSLLSGLVELNAASDPEKKEVLATITSYIASEIETLLLSNVSDLKRVLNLRDSELMGAKERQVLVMTEGDFEDYERFQKRAIGKLVFADAVSTAEKTGRELPLRSMLMGKHYEANKGLSLREVRNLYLLSRASGSL